MRIKISERKAADIKRVLVNDKPVIMAIEVDTEEGWVDVLIPKGDSLQILASKGEVIDSKAIAPEAKFETRRLTGKVEIIWYD